MVINVLVFRNPAVNYLVFIININQPNYDLMRKFVMFFSAILLINVSVMAQQATDVKAQIEKNAEIMKKALNKGDMEKFGSYFTEDVMFKMSGHEPLSGREAVTASHKPMAEQQMKLVINTEEVLDFGEYAHEIGNYEIHTRDGQKVDHGHFSTLWKKVDGNWKIHRDMISSSAAMN